MKRLFLMSLAAAGVLFASCSNDETIEVAKKNNEINFKSFINHSTRAVEDATTTNLKAFQVWGMMNKGNQTGKPFVGVEVTKGDGGWTYALRFIGKKAILIVLQLLLRLALLK